MKSRINKALITLGLAPLAHKSLETFRAARAPKNPKTDPQGHPFPPRTLTQLVTGNMSADAFLSSGLRSAEYFKTLINRNGADFGAMAAVLDFGCGCGRLARHMPSLTNAKVYGCDLNPSLIKWCQDNLNGEFCVNGLTPPLAYADDSFDALYMLSVFTHLRLETQNAWISELARILKPGGFAFHDSDHPNCSPEIKTKLAEYGFFVRNDFSEGSNFMGTFQTCDFIKAQFEADFKPIEIVKSNAAGNPVGQSVIVLERRAG